VDSNSSSLLSTDIVLSKQRNKSKIMNYRNWINRNYWSIFM